MLINLPVGSLIHPSIHMPVHCPFKPLCNYQGEVWSVIQPYVQLNHFGYSWSFNSTTCSLNCSSMLYSFYYFDIQISLYFCQSIKMSLLCRHMLISHDFTIVIVHAICPSEWFIYILVRDKSGSNNEIRTRNYIEVGFVFEIRITL